MMPKSHHARNGHGTIRPECGLTFIELLVVTSLLALALAALLPLLTAGQQTWEHAHRRTAMVQNARIALDRLVREMRAAWTLEVLTPTLIRFTRFHGDGTGAFPTVEFALNAASNELEYRWRANWAFRRQITVTAPQAVPAGYSVSVTFDHAALVTAGKSLASGNDVRMLYWTGSSWVELDRFRDIPSAWNTATTRLWFRLQAAIAADGSDGNYYLHYGNLSLGTPPANGDHVFQDYEDGATLAGWTRRDGCTGTHSASADGFVFTAADTQGCHRQYSKNVPHGDVELFWGFQSFNTSSTDELQAGVSARRSDSGVGYVVTLADEGNATLRIRYWTVWSTTGDAIVSTPASVTPGTSYYGRFYLVASDLRAKYWAVGAAEPGWMVTVTHTAVASGAHYGQVDGYAAPQDHRHRTIIVRQRVASEPTTALGVEVDGTRPDTLQPLAGPFRSMSVQCFDAAGASIACTSAASVRSVQISLVVMDPQGVVSDITVTARAFRQTP